MPGCSAPESPMAYWREIWPSRRGWVESPFPPEAGQPSFDRSARSRDKFRPGFKSPGGRTHAARAQSQTAQGRLVGSTATYPNFEKGNAEGGERKLKVVLFCGGEGLGLSIRDGRYDLFPKPMVTRSGLPAPIFWHLHENYLRPNSGPRI